MTAGPPAIHPELRSIARVLPRSAVRPSTLRPIRWATGFLGRRAPNDVEIVDLGAASVRVHRPPTRSSAPLPAVLWIHGGGYVIGTAAQDDGVCRKLATALGAVVASVEYRLAPEHPFPAPLDDCHDALVWLAKQAAVDPDRIAIAGASAGGGLAGALALLARERGKVHAAAQLLVYPMLDDRTVLRTDIDGRNHRLWNQAANRFGWASYLGGEPGRDGVPDFAAAARCDDLAGLPPAWIGVGTCDLFHDEDVAYAERLQAAGVETELQVVDGAFHAFDGFKPKTHVAQTFAASQLAFLRAALAPIPAAS